MNDRPGASGDRRVAPEPPFAVRIGYGECRKRPSTKAFRKHRMPSGMETTQ
jgi:hypothetical protein